MWLTGPGHSLRTSWLPQMKPTQGYHWSHMCEWHTIFLTNRNQSHWPGLTSAWFSGLAVHRILICILMQHIATLLWRHNGRDGVSNNQTHDCLLSRLFKHRSKKHQSTASLAFVRGINRWLVNSPHKWPVKFPFDDVIMRMRAPALCCVWWWSATGWFYPFSSGLTHWS